MFLRRSISTINLLLLALGGAGYMAQDQLIALVNQNFIFNVVVFAFFTGALFYAYYQILRLRVDTDLLAGFQAGEFRLAQKQRQSGSFLLKLLLTKYTGMKLNYTQKFAQAFYESVELKLKNRARVLNFLIQATLYLGLVGTFFEITANTPTSDTYVAGVFSVSSATLGILGYLVLRFVEMTLNNTYGGFLANLNVWLSDPQPIEPPKESASMPKMAAAGGGGKIVRMKKEPKLD